VIGREVVFTVGDIKNVFVCVRERERGRRKMEVEKREIM